MGRLVPESSNWKEGEGLDNLLVRGLAGLKLEMVVSLSESEAELGTSVGKHMPLKISQSTNIINYVLEYPRS